LSAYLFKFCQNMQEGKLSPQSVFESFLDEVERNQRSKRIQLGEGKHGATAVCSQSVFEEGKRVGPHLFRCLARVSVFPDNCGSGSAEFESQLLSLGSGQISVRFREWGEQNASLLNVGNPGGVVMMECNGHMKIWEGKMGRFVQFGEPVDNGVLVRIPAFDEALQGFAQGGPGVEVIRWGMSGPLSPEEEDALNAVRMEDLWDENVNP